MDTKFGKILDSQFYLQAPEIVARELIGKILVKKIGEDKYLAGRIIETEAYLSEGDMSSHSAPGKTKRNAAMFARGGTLYVYKIYGIHHCINAVTENEGTGSAVLIRALQPLEGIEIMRENRNNAPFGVLCKGPANLCKAFNLTAEDNFLDLTKSNLFITANDENYAEEIEVSKRIGITKSADLLLRYYLKNTKLVSGKK